MRTEAKRDEERQRNPMTTRWTDGDFKLVADTAWKRRLSTSELVRQLVIRALAAEEQEADGLSTGEPAGKAPCEEVVV